MFLHVTDVRLTKAYELRVTFSNGVVKEADLAKELYGEVFEPLKDPEFFKQVRVNQKPTPSSGLTGPTSPQSSCTNLARR